MGASVLGLSLHSIVGSFCSDLAVLFHNLFNSLYGRYRSCVESDVAPWSEQKKNLTDIFQMG